ncbi:MAG: lytic murein transglycosylase, partial [Gammaproteobacteria bacterium HGW-Gammaproteobacteria-8]
MGPGLNRFVAVALSILLMLPAARAETDFDACLVGLQTQARERGLPARIVDEVLGGLSFQSRVIELDRAQPEFRQSVAAYIRARVNQARIWRGRLALVEQAELLLRLTEVYGVPGHYLIAFWGLETNYGGFLGRMPTLDVLATLACDPRRSAMFTEQLLTALELVERDALQPDAMRGSWAGAMGHTQFMPSAWRDYAIDGDGDGRIDLWGSEADALSSAANYLKGLGWRSGERWGREVRLPSGFDYALSGLDGRRPLSEWARLG